MEEPNSLLLQKNIVKYQYEILRRLNKQEPVKEEIEETIKLFKEYTDMQGMEKARIVSYIQPRWYTTRGGTNFTDNPLLT